MADQRMTWDHDADKDLLGCVTDEMTPNQQQIRGVMDRMHSIGYTCTAKAITQHLQKLRKKEGGDGAAAGAGAGTAASSSASKATPAAKTPRKRTTKAKAAGTATPTPASKGKRKVAESFAAEDDSLDEEPPKIKKMKPEPGVNDLEISEYVNLPDNEDGAA